MQLARVNYNEFQNNSRNNYWELKDLILGKLNLIVGKNAIGKTRTINIIHNLAQIINSQANFKDGSWQLEFVGKNDEKLNYELTLIEGKVTHEKLDFNGKEKLLRNKGKTLIVSETQGKKIEIEPPDDKLVMLVRRDKKEHPFFEYLYEWAANTLGYRFGKFDPQSVTIPGDPKVLLHSLDAVPSVFEKLSESSIKQVIKNFNSIGYELEDAKLGPAANLHFNLKLIFLKEKGVKYPIRQTDTSSGMFRAFALLVVFQYLLDEKKNNSSTVLVDDFGEGLDYDRSTRLAELIFAKMNKSNIQFITTSNDRFLMNSVDIKNWNILNREGNNVSALNYQNSKNIFDKFKLTGLSNFDLFSSNYLANE